MRSVVKAAALCCVLLAWGAPAFTQVEVERSDGGQVSERDIQRAVEKLKADPDFSMERSVRTLKWKKSGEKKKSSDLDLSWLDWLKELLSWFAHNGRFLFWGGLAVLAGLLIIYLVRLSRTLRMPGRSARIDVPSFVRDLDIRPESLPDDIGAAARKLWDGGEHRAALSLLYRGLLSRLVHVHGVPIRDSTTEGDCLALASKHLFSDARKSYVTKLVRAWQRAVYGGENLPTELIHSLCDEFAGALNSADVPPASDVRGAAGATA